MKIYTRTGDDGETGLFGGGRVPKSHRRVEAYGTLDELNSCLGLARTHALPDPVPAWLEAVQSALFVLGVDLATPLDARSERVLRLGDAPIRVLEATIDTMDADLPPLKAFILPGGTPAAATLHVARAVCRRAERVCVALSHEADLNPNAVVYLNRLSDFLFTLARWVNWRAGVSETEWTGRT